MLNSHLALIIRFSNNAAIHGNFNTVISRILYFPEKTSLYSTFTLEVEVMSDIENLTNIRQHNEVEVFKICSIQTGHCICLVEDVLHCGFCEIKVTIKHLLVSHYLNNNSLNKSLF
jgi:hypothetical protein